MQNRNTNFNWIWNLSIACNQDWKNGTYFSKTIYKVQSLQIINNLLIYNRHPIWLWHTTFQIHFRFINDVKYSRCNYKVHLRQMSPCSCIEKIRFSEGQHPSEHKDDIKIKNLHKPWFYANFKHDLYRQSMLKFTLI